MARLRPLELLIVFGAAALFAVSPWWPLATLDAGASEQDALLAPPPSWLLPLDDAC